MSLHTGTFSDMRKLSICVKCGHLSNIEDVPFCALIGEIKGIVEVCPCCFFEDLNDEKSRQLFENVAWILK